MLRATIQLFAEDFVSDPAQNAYFKLSDTTNPGAVTLCETNWGFDTDNVPLFVQSAWGTLSVEWTVNVTAGPHSYNTSLYNQSNSSIYYFSTSLQAIFIPGGL